MCEADNMAADMKKGCSMYCGLLNCENSPVETLSYYTVEDSNVIPEARLSGDPMKGEPLYINGDVLHDNGIDIHVETSEACYIDTVSITFSKAGSCTGITAFNKDGLKAAEYFADTGKKVTESVISLCTDVYTNKILLRIKGSYDDISIESIELYGSYGKETGLFPEVKSYISEGGEIPVSAVDSIDYDSFEGNSASEIFKSLWKEKTGIEVSERKFGFVSFKKNTEIKPDGSERLLQE